MSEVTWVDKQEQPSLTKPHPVISTCRQSDKLAVSGCYVTALEAKDDDHDGDGDRKDCAGKKNAQREIC